MLSVFRGSLLLIVWLLFSPFLHAEGANPALYQAIQGEKKLFIVGSIHAGKDNFYPLSPPIEQALAESDALYLELAPSQMTPELIAAAMLEHASLSSPIPLKQRISEPLYQQLSQAIEHYKLPAYQQMFMRNWAIVVQLTMATISEMGLKKEFGVDQYFAAQAVQQNKPILGLETLAEQLQAMTLMDKIPAETLFQNYFDELPFAKNWLLSVEQAWRQGNSEQLVQLYQDYDKRQIDAELMNALLNTRNKNWQQKLTQLPSGKTYLLVVGDMHLHGADSLLTRLRESGFNIQRINP